MKLFLERRLNWFAALTLGLLLLTGAAFAEYKLANVPRPVDLKTTGKFSPATIRRAVS